MVEPPSDDEPRGAEPETTADPDRAAILSRRQRFIALALSGLAAACDKPNGGATKPEDPKHEGKDDEANPEPCLKVAMEPDVPDAKPVPCLEVVAEPGDDDAGLPSACLKIAAPPTEPPSETPPQPCLRVVAPQPPTEPKPEPCLKVAAPPPEEPAKPRPCLKIAKPRDE